MPFVASTPVQLADGSRIAAAYGAKETHEEYHCRFALDETWREKLAGGQLAFTAFDEQGSVRGAELRDHPFFVATLFQPERAALRGVLPPLVVAFVRAALAFRARAEGQAKAIGEGPHAARND